MIIQTENILQSSISQFFVLSFSSLFKRKVTIKRKKKNQNKTKTTKILIIFESKTEKPLFSSLFRHFSRTTEKYPAEKISNPSDICIFIISERSVHEKMKTFS